MSGASALLAWSLLATALAGCAAAAADAPPASPVGTACPNPDCGRHGAPKPRAIEAESAVEQESAKVAKIRGPGSVALEARVDSPVRGVLVSNGRQILVEVRLQEVAAPLEKRPGLARFSMRLRDEDETVQVEELRPSKRPGWHYDAVPDGWSGDAVSGVPFFRYFARSGGTAWEIDGILDVLDGGGVRFTLRPVFQICTK